MLGFVHYSSASATTEFNQDLCFTPTHNDRFWWHPSHQNPEKWFLQFTSSSFCNERPEYLNISMGKADLQQPLLWPRQNLKYTAHLFSLQFPTQNEGGCSALHLQQVQHTIPPHSSAPTKKNYLRHSLVSAVLLNTPQNHFRTDMIGLMRKSKFWYL